MSLRNFLIAMLLTGLVLLGQTSCTHETGQRTSQSFFSLQSYARAFARDSLTVKVKKTVQVNGKKESKVIEAYPIFEDVLTLEHYDIDRPAMYDKYLVDTIRSGDQTTLVYTAQAPELRVRKLTVNLLGQEVEQIAIESKTESFSGDTQLSLHWKPVKELTLHRYGKKMLQDSIDQSVLIEVIP